MNRNKMNRRANLYLNIYRAIAVVLCFLCMGLAITLHEVVFKIPLLLNSIVILIGIVSGFLFISIEVFLFLILNKKSKILYISYIIIDILLAVIINTIYPFSGFLILLGMSLLKDLLRVKYVDKIYQPKEFKRYCKMFNIKISDFKKKKISPTVITKNQEIIEIPKEDSEIIPKNKTKKKTAPVTN